MESASCSFSRQPKSANQHAKFDPVRIEQLWRFPVKSMQGERLDQVPVTAMGLEGDRWWSLVDAATQKTLTGRREPRLLQATARVESDSVVVTLPDGTDADGDHELSQWLERDVQLVAADSDQVGTYETQLDESESGDWFEWQGPVGSFHDSTRARVSLASMDTFGEWATQRFRTNVLLAGGAARSEDSLVGSMIRLGTSVNLDVTKQIDRCVMVTRPLPAVDRDLDVLRTINRDHGGFLGVGALVNTPGMIAIGDLVVPQTGE